MTRSRHRSSKRATAILGVAVIVVAALIGYVSYNALSGLPFQSRYHVSIKLPDAERLRATDDVRIASVRVGQVADVTVEAARSGAPPSARVRLALDPAVGRLPVDTTATVRAASALGATYVQLTLGDATRTVPPGGTLPLTDARGTVAVTDLFQVFDRSATRNFQSATASLAVGLAGRGEALNSTIGSLAGLLPDATDVASALAAPEAQLSTLLSSWASTASVLGPESLPLARVVSNGARTLGAFAEARRSFESAIESAPTAERATTTAFVAVRPALDGLAELMTDLEPAARRLPSALATINSTLAAGRRPLDALPELSRPLGRAMRTLETVSRIPSTDGALRKLADVMHALEETLAVLTPAQRHCNILGLFTQNMASAIGALGSGEGPSMAAFNINTLGNSTDLSQSRTLAPNAHINNNPVENAQACQAGNEPYDPDVQALTAPAFNYPNHTRATHPPPGVRERAASVGLLASEAP